MSSKRDATPGRSPVKKNWRERKASKKKELQDAVERDEKLRQEEKERVRAVEQAEWEKAAVEAGLEQEERKLGQGGTPVTREERKDQLIRIAEAKGPGALVELILDLEYPSATGSASVKTPSNTAVNLKRPLPSSSPDDAKKKQDARQEPLELPKEDTTDK